MVQVKITWRMLDGGDLVKGNSDLDAGVGGYIKGKNVNWCSEIIVKLYIWGPPPCCRFQDYFVELRALSGIY